MQGRGGLSNKRTPEISMKPRQMDADLALIHEPQQMSARLSYWETRRGLARLSKEDQAECDRIAIKHASRVARVVRIG